MLIILTGLLLSFMAWAFIANLPNLWEAMMGAIGAFMFGGSIVTVIYCGYLLLTGI